MLITGGLRLAQAQPQYTVHDLGAGFQPAGINKAGEVVGNVINLSTDPNTYTAFRTAPNAAMNPATDNLGTFGGTSTVVHGINASGQAVGGSNTSDGVSHGFRTAPNASINPATDDIGSLGGSGTTAFGINDSGQVTGSSVTASGGYSRAFVTGANSAINPATDDIGDLTFSPKATEENAGLAVNSSGVVSGQARLSPFFNNSAFVYQSGAITEITDFLDSSGSNFTNINDQGQIAYGASANGDIEVWQNGNITSLIPNSQCGACEPDGINNSLQLVGHTFAGPRYVFLYTNRTVYQLNDLIPADSGWALLTSAAINDLGQIVGTGLFNGVSHGFRLDPASLCTAPTISSAAASPSQIWPPNHKLVPVSVSYTGSSSCDPTYTLSVAGGSGSGSSVVVDANNVQLRADQDAAYTITISGTNSAGTGTASVQVVVANTKGN